MVDSLHGFDTLVIPSWPTQGADIAPTLASAIQSFYKNKQRILSFCSGSFLLAQLGLLDGKQATMEIRKIEEETGRHVPIVALTAHAMAGDSEGILAAGLDHYLTKPLRKALILERIGEYAPQDAQPIDLSPAA